MCHPAHKNRAMIPALTYRPAIQSHLVTLVMGVTERVMLWHTSKFTLPRQLHTQLKARGFQNPEFTELCQYVVDYCDYLLYGNLTSQSQQYPQEAVTEAVFRSLELYLAKHYDRQPHLLKELDVMGRNKTLAHIEDFRLLQPKLLKHLQQRNEQLEKLQ